jgi:hypothetical protein
MGGPPEFADCGTTWLDGRVFVKVRIVRVAGGGARIEVGERRREEGGLPWYARARGVEMELCTEGGLE